MVKKQLGLVICLLLSFCSPLLGMSKIGIFAKNALQKSIRISTTGMHYWLISGKDLFFLYISGKLIKWL